MKRSCAVQLDEASRTIDAFVATVNPTKASVLSVFNKLDIILGNTASLAGLLGQVHPSSDVREAAVACELDAARFESSVYSPKVFQHVQLATDPPLDAQASRRFKSLLRGFHRLGAHLDETQWTQVRKIRDEIDELSVKYKMALSSDTRYVRRKVTDIDSLRGLPREFIDSRTKDGEVVISTNYPDYQPAIKFAADANLRRDLFVAAQQRGFPDNVQTLEQVLQKRYEMATLLGYKSYADYATEELMVQSADRVDRFLTHLANHTADAAAQELDTLLKAKQQDDPNAQRVEAFDSSYYFEKLRSERFSVNSSEVSEYFSYATTRDGILAFASRMFGIRFERTKTRGWHPNVEVYHVYWSRKGVSAEMIGRIFLDMFPRENKYKHAAHFRIRVGIQGVQIPEAALICNFPATGPMEHSQVTTFFHEFGHLMHHVMGGQQQTYAEFSGVATERDFVEAPSQMLEEWALDEKTLQSFAIHPKTHKPIPSTLIQKMKTASAFGRRLSKRQQVFLSRLSLELHAAFSEGTKIDSTKIMLELQDKYSPFPAVPETYFQANFGHLMGYSAIYYTYLWSESFAKHMFSVFAAAPNVLDEGVATKYRDLVLSPGGTLPAEVLVFNFVEREFSLDAFLGWLNEQPTC
eukprot:c5263_g1_i1.p1 GENE.c5263_g1_i1~~c5263_g1_i1.p1  ORF type:complete len:722 (-),score=158.62 c5263_g1_i1:48-1958(-)